MGHYVSIRGWMDCPESQLHQIRNLIESFVDRASDYGLPTEGAEMYNKGWVIPEEHINWTHYIFYGADIRIQYLNYIKDQMISLGESISENDGPYIEKMDGVFDIEDEENEIKEVWRVANGVFSATSQSR